MRFFAVVAAKLTVGIRVQEAGVYNASVLAKYHQVTGAAIARHLLVKI